MGLVGAAAVAVGIALTTAAIAAAMNTLPASVVLAGVLGGGAAGAVLTGLAVGALATPPGCVSTLIALGRAQPGDGGAGRGHVRRRAPVALAATALAAALVAVTGSP